MRINKDFQSIWLPFIRKQPRHGAESEKAYHKPVSLKTINLQLFAEGGEKTEKATPKKRQEARKKGQVLQSREITGAVTLTFLFVGLKIFGGFIYSQLSSFFKEMLVEYSQVGEQITPAIVYKIFIETVTVLLKTTAPLFIIALVTGVVAGYAQVGFLFTMETLGFKFSKLNPLSGVKRMFSVRSIVELAKAVLKLVIVGIVAYSYLNGEKENVVNLMNMDAMGVTVYIGTTATNVAIRICIALIFLGLFDFIYQWWDYEKNLKMSKQEIKEEFKQAEGNPEIKSKIKQKQREMSMRRMLQEVPKADVVITNPTHFAVAIKYDQKVSDAPVVIAKGQDFIASRIKDVARENKVEIVENKPLARALYGSAEIGDPIPPELYQAVAEVLAFVYSLKQKDQVM